jgi:hypothetical protein
MCPAPRNISQGSLSYLDTTYQATIEYRCQEGFNLVGQRTRSCLHTGRIVAHTAGFLKVIVYTARGILISAMFLMALADFIYIIYEEKSKCLILLLIDVKNCI